MIPQTIYGQTQMKRWAYDVEPIQEPENDNSFHGFLKNFADKQVIAANGYRAIPYYELANFKYPPVTTSAEAGGFFYDLLTGLAFLLFMAGAGVLMVMVSV